MFFGRKQQAVSWIVVFLGNPGRDYIKSRHNVGFMVADAVAKTAGVKIDRLKYKSLTAAAALGGARVFLMKPQTYMNLSGDAVRQAMNFYKTPTENIIVISDDVSLPAGKLRIRRNGSAGGHNGLKDIISKCGGDEFPRIKVGVGSPPHADFEMADWVLSAPTGNDKKEIDAAVLRAAEAIEVIISQGVDRAMNLYN